MSSRCTPGRGWTRRLRRHGGLHKLTEKRIAQFKRLHAIVAVGGPHLDVATNLITWMRGNALRVLSATAEEFFGWRMPPETSPEHQE